ncbi:hypothetical protein ACFV5G_22745 [Streptomyces sp. NPDC059766]|uniref:hypothetical protein n=1 Tax=Streptomyces sp. NPDC059766 TaxID=3346940 RepID=UPI0036550304
MSVTWAATAPESGRFCAVERCSDVGELAHRFHELRSRGRGYLEVGLPGSEFPRLTLGFQGDQAVLHLFDDAEGVYLLVGDGITSPDALVDVPIMDDLAAFGDDFVVTVDHAWAAVNTFIQTRATGGLGEWHAL